MGFSFLDLEDLDGGMIDDEDGEKDKVWRKDRCRLFEAREGISV